MGIRSKLKLTIFIAFFVYIKSADNCIITSLLNNSSCLVCKSGYVFYNNLCTKLDCTQTPTSNSVSTTGPQTASSTNVNTSSGSASLSNVSTSGNASSSSSSSNVSTTGSVTNNGSSQANPINVSGPVITNIYNYNNTTNTVNGNNLIMNNSTAVFNGNNTSASSSNPDDGLPMWAKIVIALCSALAGVISAIAVIWKLKKKNEKENEGKEKPVKVEESAAKPFDTNNRI